MAKYIIRYNVYLSLASGGGKVGQFKTLEDAETCVKEQGCHCQIVKAYYERIGSTNKLFEVGHTIL